MGGFFFCLCCRLQWKCPVKEPEWETLENAKGVILGRDRKRQILATGWVPGGEGSAPH